MYQLSKNYDKLYELINESNRVVGFVNFVNYDHCRDVCAITRKNQSIDIRVRGTCYAWIDAHSSIDESTIKTEFIHNCNVLDLEWIEP
jgi:hypothetical protein